MNEQQDKTTRHRAHEYLLAGVLSIMLVFTGMFAAQKASQGASAAWTDITAAMARAEHSLCTPGW